jgi:hypothetical protein
MSNTMNSEPREQKLTTAGLAASANQQRPPRKEVGAPRQEPPAPQADAELQTDAAPQDDKPPPDETPPQDRSASGTNRASGSATDAATPSGLATGTTTKASAPASGTTRASGPATGPEAAAATSDQRDLAPLFAEDVAIEFRARWDVVQRGFVDDPSQSVRAGDELVAQVIKSLAETFSGQRASLEGGQADQASTENLRLALRRYRSFFERLLSI